MPRIHERTFTVRHYECNFFGRLYPSAYLQYMQESAYQASAAAGFDMVSYERSGRRWFVRETNIDYFLPVHYSQPVTVRTWVEDFHRVRSIRAYELTAGGQMAARAWSDWVFLDAETLRPVTVPPDMVRGFVPEWQPHASRPRPRFPAAPMPTMPPHSSRRTVDWPELDPARHVNNAKYPVYTHEAHLQSLAASGWTTDRLEKAGVDILPRRQHIEYRIPALYNDELEIQVITSPATDEEYHQYYTIVRARDQELLARSQASYRCIRLSDESACPFPPAFLAEFTTRAAQ
jgi:acyl-CoA thioester hydrolase